MKTTEQTQSPALALTFGADPEFFIFDNEENKIVSAIPVLKRDKNDPIVLDKKGNVKLYYDNAMGEFTVRPADSKEDFIKSIGESLHLINDFLIDGFGGKYSIRIQASHNFEPEQLDHEDALKVGCNPEYSADTVSDIVPPDFSGSLRSSGAHFAVGIMTKDERIKDFQSSIDLVKLFDYFVAIPFTLIDNDSTSTQRRILGYGSKSSHRPKPEYGDLGLEYRVLGNYWLNSPKLVGLVYDLAIYAIERLFKNDYQDIVKLDYHMGAAAIKENNKELSREIIEQVGLPKNFMIRLNQLQDVKSWDLSKEWDFSKSKVSESSMI